MIARFVAVTAVLCIVQALATVALAALAARRGDEM